MTSLPEPLVEGSTGCIYCPGIAEPEQDGDVVYLVCKNCAGEFGHRKLRQGAFCAAGLPVPVAEPVLIATTITMRRPE